MSGSKRGPVRAAIAGCAFVAAGLIHCSLGGHQCIQMSDCESGFMCVEGTCETNESLAAPTDSEGGVSEAGSTASTATDQ